MRQVVNLGHITSKLSGQHIISPDNFTTEMETTISQIAAMADDPFMKAVIVNQAIPGTTPEGICS